MSSTTPDHQLLHEPSPVMEHRVPGTGDGNRTGPMLTPDHCAVVTQ